MFQYIKIRIKIGVLLDMRMCKKCLFTFLAILGQISSLLVTMATSNKRREWTIAHLIYKYNLCGHLNRASSKCNQRKTHISLKGFNFTFFLGQISIFVIFWPYSKTFCGIYCSCCHGSSNLKSLKLSFVYLHNRYRLCEIY